MGFIANNKGKRLINRLCEILRVIESGYHKHLRNLNKPPKHADLLAQIRKILLEYEENYNYGVRRIYFALILKKGYTGSFLLPSA